MAEYDAYNHEQLEIKMMPLLDTNHPNYVANPNVSTLHYLETKKESICFKYKYKQLYFRFWLKGLSSRDDFEIL